MEKESSSLVARLNLLCACAAIRKSPSPSKPSSLLCSYATHVTRNVNCCVLSDVTTKTITNALFTVVYLLREISKPAKGTLLRFCCKQFLLEACFGKGKGKALPLQAWTGPKGSRRLRLPDFKTIGT